MVWREEYFAKSVQENGHQPTVQEHLRRVADLAENFGSRFNCSNEAWLAGQLHDFGKYSESFQERLDDKSKEGPGIDHAICGAILIMKLAKKYSQYRPIVECICGHHRGLREYGELYGILEENLTNPKPIEINGRYIALSGKEQYQKAMRLFQMDFPNFRIPDLRKKKTESSEISEMLFTRMLFSCLVDADYSVSASDERPDYLQKTGSIPFDVDRILKSLYSFRENICNKSRADKRLNEIRDKVFDVCGNAGEITEGNIYTLTAPTGVGKTLALLHFALRHCQRYHKDRIIIVLPFLTLTEQNADTYRKVFPDILEDHSQRDLNEEEREYAARWSAPFIVTTSVRFFESLFSSKPTDCRKLHHLANSVVIFDEAQSLPVDLTASTLNAVNELCRRYRCTMLFSTATQPDFDAIKNVSWKPLELIPDNKGMYKDLARTQIEWRINTHIRFQEIAREMKDHTSVCTIVNLRKHARILFQSLETICSKDEIYYLTTDLCTEHRRSIVKKIKKRLQSGLPCRVVATQCIEAGVDLDFDRMYRALGPLDSIIQAAGRCNRNGTLQGKGVVTVFLPEEDGKRIYPDNWYEHAALTVENILYDHPIDIHDPNHIKEYYNRLYESARDKKELINSIEDKDYEKVDKEYKLIANQGFRVIIPYSENNKSEASSLFEDIRKDVLQYGLTPMLVKKAASITVTVSRVQEKQLEMIAERILYRFRGKCSDRYSDFFIIRNGRENVYTNEMGLQIEEDVEIDPFI